MSGFIEASAQIDTIPNNQKQYEYYRHLWEDQSPNFPLLFPFALEDFNNPEEFKRYRLHSIAAYAASMYLVPDWGYIRRSGEKLDPLDHFLYRSEDSIIRYRPQEVFCLHRLDEVTDSIEKFADNIKALVISGSFSSYIKDYDREVIRVLAAFKNVTYLELGDINNQANTRGIMELILQNRPFDQLEFLYVNNITMEQTITIHERYRQLKSLSIRDINNQDDISLPNPFLNSLNISLLRMPLPTDRTTGYEFCHLTKLESLILDNGLIPFTNESLSPLTHLKYLLYQTSTDTILFRNTHVEMLSINLACYDRTSFISIDAPSLIVSSLSCVAPGSLKVEVLNMEKSKSLNIHTNNKIDLEIKSKMKSLTELSLYSDVVDFYCRHKLPKDLVLYSKESIGMNYQKGSKKLPYSKH
jgi:hypothetical protein